MNGIMKLKIVITLLLLLMIITFIGSTIVTLTEESDAIDAYESLSYDDQIAVGRFSDRLTDYTNLYAVFGYMQIAVAFGLFLLLFRLWNMKNI